MKKVISLALALMMLFLFVSCGKGEEQSIPSMIKAAYKGLESETWIRSIPRAKKFNRLRRARGLRYKISYRNFGRIHG